MRQGTAPAAKSKKLKVGPPSVLSRSHCPGDDVLDWELQRHEQGEHDVGHGEEEASQSRGLVPRLNQHCEGCCEA